MQIFWQGIHMHDSMREKTIQTLSVPILKIDAVQYIHTNICCT